MHLISLRSTSALVKLFISSAPDGGFHQESVGTQTKVTHVPHDMLREVKVQIARWHQGGTPFPHTNCMNQREHRP